MENFFSYIPGMMSWIGNHIDFPIYISEKLIKIYGVMAWDLKYGIDEVAYGSFYDYTSTRMELPVFFNARMMWNAWTRCR